LFVYSAIVIVVMTLGSSSLLPNTSNAQSQCPYKSIQARVRVPGGNWVKNLNISCGQVFQMGSFVNNDFSDYSSSLIGSLRVKHNQILTPSNGSILQMNADTPPPGSNSVSYSVHVPGYIGVAGCFDRAVVTCSSGQVSGTNNFDETVVLSKSVVTDKRDFLMGENIDFLISITNESTQTLTNLSLTDEYPAKNLRFVGIKDSQGNDLTNYFEINHQNGTIRIEDIIAFTKTISYGESISLIASFVTINSGDNICNNIATQGSNATACINIIHSIPPATDF